MHVNEGSVPTRRQEERQGYEIAHSGAAALDKSDL